VTLPSLSQLLRRITPRVSAFGRVERHDALGERVLDGGICSPISYDVSSRRLTCFVASMVDRQAPLEALFFLVLLCSTTLNLKTKP
jgi:hypothetical protein